MGCGNGYFMGELLKFGYFIFGLDASHNALHLASNLYSSCELIQTSLTESCCFRKISKIFLFDKGTLDAISLLKYKRTRAIIKYLKYIEDISIAFDTNFMITSCNFTRDELLKLLEQLNPVVIAEIPHPTFTYAGCKGQTVTTLIFCLNCNKNEPNST